MSPPTRARPLLLSRGINLIALSRQSTMSFRSYRPFLFLPLLLALAATVTPVSSSACPQASTGDQRPLIPNFPYPLPLQGSNDTICPLKPDFVFQLEQLSWYMKGDCQAYFMQSGQEVSIMDGCPCVCNGPGCACAASCKKDHHVNCCFQRMTFYMVYEGLKELNEMYRNISASKPPCCRG